MKSVFWRTLEERANDPAFQQFLHDEFPAHGAAALGTPDLHPDRGDNVERRAFLKLMGASIALAGASACTRQPLERIVPYVEQPEQLIPGRPLFFATAMSVGGSATGLLVESHEGRPTKIEGNPLHPASLGASDAVAQAAILGLYDPDRSTTLTYLGDIQPWSAFLGAIRAALNAQQPLRGAGLRILTESVNSPTLAAQIRDLLARYPSAKWHQWDPMSHQSARAGAKLAFGRYVDAQYRLDQADLILSLDSDFLACGSGSLRYARDFASRRRPEQADRMSRFYAIETMPTPTGSRADHRLPLKPSQIEQAAWRLAAALRATGSVARSAEGTAPRPDGLGTEAHAVLEALAADLRAHRGRSLIIAGDTQPPSVHALTHAMNQALENVGRTVAYTDPVEAEPVDQIESLRDLVADMNTGRVDLLIIISGNPVYTVPADLGFSAALGKVQLRAHLGLYDDETSALCHWQIPEAHFLEAWSDARAYDGTASIVQPLIAPLYGGKSAHELMAAFSDRPERSGYDIVREFWRVDASNETTWRRWLHDGVIPGTAFTLRNVRVAADALMARRPSEPGAAPGIEVDFRPDPSVLDGRFANNGWLQELPKPITKVTWDNAILMSPSTAANLRVRIGPSYVGGEHGRIVSDVVELRYGGRAVRGPAFAVVGHADDCVTIHLGYGRQRGGHLANGAGFDANRIRTADAPWIATGAELVRTGQTYPLACTQYHHLMEGRGLVRAVARDEYLRDPRSMHEGPDIEEAPPRAITLNPEYKYDAYKWGMAIDVNACVGCNACVVACQSENNIPVIGKEQVLRGREMHWIRIDTYYRGPAANPETYFQPVPCMQCENAPCEVVCPVAATVHSHEGLNDMVYNRCVGTRYCSNNCPYKVRRFNFLLYQDWYTPSLKLARNPDVTVRSRGVMEKCTYCIQRINEAKIDSEKQDRRLRDGDVVPACQQACPAEAIIFGDLNDPNSRVARLQAEQRNYALLGELNTRPRTTYLGAVRNVNPVLRPDSLNNG